MQDNIQAEETFCHHGNCNSSMQLTEMLLLLQCVDATKLHLVGHVVCGLGWGASHVFRVATSGV
jgi:hypothetical protein